ncbi:MAG: ribonuclease Z [Hyphomicrobiales bacterium]
MSWLVQTRLVNEPFSDPGLFIDFLFGSRAILFDIGDITSLSARELLRTSDVFVSHRHMDHFAGFDHLLRANLHRPKTLRLVGPPGFVDGVDAKLRAYLWNLLDQGAPDFVIRAAEFENDRLGAWTLFRARDRFRRTAGEASGLGPGLVLEEDDLRIECGVIDHGTPCLAFALQERRRVNVWPEGLEGLGLQVGPWLNEAKSAVRRGAPGATRIPVGSGYAVPLSLLEEHALRIARGQRIAYVTDAAFHPENARRIVALAKDCHHLYIEAAFLDEDEPLATARRHLTAREAGELAGLAGARRLTTFHHSPRYLDRPEAFDREAQSAFRAAAAETVRIATEVP